MRALQEMRTYLRTSLRSEQQTNAAHRVFAAICAGPARARAMSSCLGHLSEARQCQVLSGCMAGTSVEHKAAWTRPLVQEQRPLKRRRSEPSVGEPNAPELGRSSDTCPAREVSRLGLTLDDAAAAAPAMVFAWARWHSMHEMLLAFSGACKPLLTAELLLQSSHADCKLEGSSVAAPSEALLPDPSTSQQARPGSRPHSAKSECSGAVAAAVSVGAVTWATQWLLADGDCGRWHMLRDACQRWAWELQPQASSGRPSRDVGHRSASQVSVGGNRCAPRVRINHTRCVAPAACATQQVHQTSHLLLMSRHGPCLFVDIPVGAYSDDVGDDPMASWLRHEHHRKRKRHKSKRKKRRRSPSLESPDDGVRELSSSRSAGRHEPKSGKEDRSGLPVAAATGSDRPGPAELAPGSTCAVKACGTTTTVTAREMVDVLAVLHALR